jgi:hypothetical protein
MCTRDLQNRRAEGNHTFTFFRVTSHIVMGEWKWLCLEYPSSWHRFVL